LAFYPRNSLTVVNIVASFAAAFSNKCFA